MRALVMNPEIKKRIADHVAWADLPENWWYPEKDQESPGDNPAYVVLLDMGFRVVYTKTAVRDKRLRQLSVSVEGDDGKYPNEVVAFSICTLFGFTGGVLVHEMTVKPGADWMIDMADDPPAIVFAQEIREEKTASA